MLAAKKLKLYNVKNPRAYTRGNHERGEESTCRAFNP